MVDNRKWENTMTFQPGHKANTGRKRPQWVKDKIGNSHIGITHTKTSFNRKYWKQYFRNETTIL